MNEELTRYYYDKILERNVYGVVPNERDMEKMLKIAKLYKELSSEDSRKYVAVRLEMLVEENVNEIGKVVFSRGMTEKVYPIYDNMGVTFRGVRINGRRPSEYRIERSVKSKEMDKYFEYTERIAKVALEQV